MDKKLNRVVGFQKPKGEVAKPAPLKKEVKVVKTEKEIEKEPEIEDVEFEVIPEETTPVKPLVSESQNEGKDVVMWLKEHDFINRSALCKAAKVDRANFDKYLKLGELPEKMANPIAEQLKKYGYAK